MDQTQKKMKNTKNTKTQPNNVKPKSNQIWSKQRHIYVENHARINNLASIHFDYHLNIMILFRLKTEIPGLNSIKNLLLM
jgi:hypothetical protein